MVLFGSVKFPTKCSISPVLLTVSLQPPFLVFCEHLGEIETELQ